MSDVLRFIAEDAAVLKDAIIGARATGDLTPVEAQQAITAAARVIQVIMEARAPGPKAERVGAWTGGPLSEFLRWPSVSMPCPKCGASKEKSAEWFPLSKDGPERIKHSCRCGFYIVTKPCDQSAASSWDDSPRAPAVEEMR